MFRELFLNGLTVLDLPTVEPARAEGASQLSAREEVESLLQSIALVPQPKDTVKRAVSV